MNLGEGWEHVRGGDHDTTYQTTT